MFLIKYVLLVPPNDKNITPFQGFNLDVTEADFAEIIHALTYLPSHALEIFMTQENLLNFRHHSSPRNITAINSSLFSKDIVSEDDVLYIIACLSNSISSVVEIISSLKIKPIIISTSDKYGIINIKKNTPSAYILDREIYQRISDYQINKKNKLKNREIRSSYNSKLDRPESGGGAIIANEIFLKGLGFSFDGHASLPAVFPERYRNYVEEMAEISVEKTTFENFSNEVIIYSPAISPYLYDTEQGFWNRILKKINIKWHKDFIIDGLIKNPYYSGFIVNKITKDNPAADPIVASILRLRQRELHLTNISVCLLATSMFSTPIRLPNAVNLHFLKLKELEEFARRGDAEALLLRQEKFKEINACLKMEIGDKLSKLITNKASYCTICSDMPLEWVYLDKLPLMISHEVSKIPMTPGNMLLQYCAPGDGINLSAAAFEKILVLRSFDEDDRLKLILEKSINGFPISKKTSVQFVDVNTVDEVVEALNGFQGALVVFDCHGSHDGPDGNGWLKIGNQQLNTWELAHIAHLPPIVLLSACLTSAIGGSHASVANGLLRSGALSVLGTLLPVNGIQSAIFMARLIYRLDSFLPAIKQLGFQQTTFRTLISTFFRMSYLTEILDYFEKEEKILSRDDYVKLHIEGNFMINSLSSKWYDETINKLSKITNQPEDQLLSRIHTSRPLMETMLYCQHGRPELITIHL